MIQIDWQSRTPIYDQLVRGIVRMKSLGVMKSGEQLPSVRNLATSLGVNPNTVQKAYQMLEAHGVIYSVSGKGSFLAENSTASQLLLQSAESRVNDAVIEAIQTGVEKSKIDKIVDEAYKKSSINPFTDAKKAEGVISAARNDQKNYMGGRSDD